jgi:hypothetical protein
MANPRHASSHFAERDFTLAEFCGHDGQFLISDCLTKFRDFVFFCAPGLFDVDVFFEIRLSVRRVSGVRVFLAAALR